MSTDLTGFWTIIGCSVESKSPLEGWYFIVTMRNSAEPNGVQQVISRHFMDEDTCAEHMNDCIQMKYLENEENGWPFVEEEAEIRFHSDVNA